MDGQAVCCIRVSDLLLMCRRCMIVISGELLVRRLIEGRNVLRKLEKVESYNERPLKLCQVSNCGKLTAGQQIIL